MPGRASPGPGTSTRAATSGGAGSIAYWMLVGALAGFGLAAAFTVGAFLLAAALALAVLGLALRRVDKRMSPAILIGGATAPLYVAWLNRSGPGEVCESVDGGVRCLEQWSPWPLVAVALVLVIVGTALVRALRRSGPA